MADIIINNSVKINNMENDSSSNTNTILIVLVLLILVGFGVWWFTMRSKTAPVENTSGINVDVNLPGSGATTPPPAQ